MIINLCLACRRVNLPEASSCDACGASLEDCDTAPLPLNERPGAKAPGALWLEDLVQSRGPAPEPAPFNLSLRNVQVPPPVEPPLGRQLIEGLLVSDVSLPSLPRLHPGPAPTSAAPAQRQPLAPAPVAVPPLLDAEARRARKAERRAGVRKARLRSLSAGHAEGPAAVEVLVMDTDVPARLLLGVLLQRFGFTVHAVHAAPRALEIARSRPLVAAFVGIAPDDFADPGLALCRELKAPAADNPLLLVGVAAQLRPLDRVHADLAGCDELIAKPVSRGSVARALDAHEIALPTDARRA